MSTTPAYTGAASNDSRHPKPTLLAFHGSGSNATIHTIQLARLSRLLRPHFDIVSMEGPFASPAGPGILPFFDGCGPFYRWIPPGEAPSISAMRAGSGASALPAEVTELIRSTVLSIQGKGGAVVGLLGFSQGTRVVAGLLGGAQIKREKAAAAAAMERGEELAWLDFGFAVSVCGSFPPPLVPGGLLREGEEAPRIRCPTLHVHGSQDEYEWAGKLLVERCYEVGEGMSEAVTLDIGHHYPVKAEETQRIAEWVVETHKRTAAEKLAVVS